MRVFFGGRAGGGGASDAPGAQLLPLLVGALPGWLRDGRAQVTHVDAAMEESGE